MTAVTPDPVVWATGSTTLFAGQFDAVTVGGGLWVAVGAGGEIQTSANGAVWGPQASGSTEDLRAVAYDGSGLFCAVGNNGTILTSADGIAWTARTAYGSYTDDFVGVAHDQSGLWMIIGNGTSDEVHKSADGITWADATPASALGTYQAIAFGNSRWVIRGFITTPNWLAQAQVTTDEGSNWSTYTASIADDSSLSATMPGLTYGNGLFVAVGADPDSGADDYIETSTDGTSWTAQSVAVWLGFNTVTWTGSIFVAAGTDGKIATSSDGLTWTSRTAAASYSGAFQGATNDGTTITLVGASAGIQGSADGITWSDYDAGAETALTEPADREDGYTAGDVLTAGDVNWLHNTIATWFEFQRFFALANYGSKAPATTSAWTAHNANGIAYTTAPTPLWVRVGNTGYINTSPDGVTWTVRSPGSASSTTFEAVAHGGDRWVIAANNELQLSPDGVTWTLSAPSPGGGGIDYLKDVAYNGSNLWCAVGENSIGAYASLQYSSDGISWTGGSVASNNDNMMAVEHNRAGLWCAVGEGGDISTSSNGTSWTSRTAAGSYTDDFRGIAYGAGLWVIVGETSEIQSSADGITWASHTVAGSLNFRSVRYSYGGFIAVAATGETYVSTDGTTWTAGDATGGTGLRGIASNGAGRWIAVGDSSDFAYSLDGVTWSTPTGNPSPDSYRAIIWTGTKYFVGSTGSEQESSDGDTWSTATGAGSVEEFATDGSRIVAARVVTTVGISDDDGDTWTTIATGAGGNLLGAGHDGSALWCAVGVSGSIVTSPTASAASWTTRTPAASYAGTFQSVAHNQVDLWCAVGTSGEIQTSPDGTTWTARTPDDSYAAQFNRVRYADGLWVIVGGAGVGNIQTSPDGITWSSSTTVSTWAINSCDYCEDLGVWIAVGTSGLIATSPDAITWTVRESGVTPDLHDVDASNGRAVIVGTSGVILSSFRITQ